MKMKSCRVGSFGVLLLIANIFCLVAQSPTDFLSKKKRFDHISIKEGLSQSAINCIMQDSKGFMWFGTQEGLNKYDGYKFIVYRHEPGNPHSLISNSINTIYESDKDPGILWIGTAGGLCTYDSKTCAFTTFSNILKNAPVNAIVEDTEGNFWFGSTDEGLIKYGRKKNDQIRYQKSNVTVLMKDENGCIWIGSKKGGLSKLDKKTNTLIPYPKSGTGLTDNRVLTLLCDQDGDIWIGTDGGGLTWLKKDKNGREIFTHFPTNPNDPGGLNNGHIKTIIQDKTGLFWIGTAGGGISCLQKETKQFRSFTKDPNNPYSLSYNDIEVIFEDKAGSLWIGTQGDGINKIDSRYDNFELYQYEPYNPGGLRHEKIWSIVESKDGSFWIGTDGGVYNFDMVKDKFQHINHNITNPNSLIHNLILSICEDNSGNLWLGSDGGGLYKYIRAENRSLHYTNDPQNSTSISNNRIYSIIQDSTGRLWFGTEGGISCLNLNAAGNKHKKEISFTRYIHEKADPSSLSHNQVFTIYEDKNKTIWVGTRGGGLNRFDPIRRCFQHFKNKADSTNSISDNILSIVMDSTGVLWLGTEKGLNKFDIKNGTWTLYTKKDGLPNNIIYGILEENLLPGKKVGKLWISTNGGLSCFDSQALEFKNYDAHDGLQSNEFNTNAYTKSKKGVMFFGGINGFNVFNPSLIKNNSYVPPVILTYFNINSKQGSINTINNSIEDCISGMREIRLSYRQNSFSFGFTALNYIQPEKNRYKYKLEGYNDEWIPMESRQMVVYTKVPSGHYVFKVKGSNNDGIWNEQGTSMGIKIAPPFWLTWWFILLMGLLSIGILYFLQKRHTTHLKEKLEKIRLEKELQLKADFTAMLVHDLRSPLTAIVGYAQMMEEMPLMVDMHKTGNVISRSCDNMLRLINDMLDLSKFEAGKMALNKINASLYEIVRDNLEIMMPLIKKKEIKLIWEPSEDVKKITLFIDPGKIGQVLNNLLSNAIKFVPDNGKGNIIITLLQVDKFMELSLSNNGPIIPKQDRESLFDMYAQLNMRSRVKGTGLGLAVSKVIIESHGGIINYRPGENVVGSTFYFRLPISQEY